MAYRYGIKRLLVAIIVIAIAAAFFVSRQHHFVTPTPAQLQNAFPGETRQVLEHSTQFTLLSLEPTIRPVGTDNKTITFHGYRVLGRMQVTDPHQKQKLLRALDDGIARSQVVYSCFSPRHGIHAIAGNQSVDMVICFHCQQFELFSGQQEKVSGISAAPQRAFDEALSAAGISLASR